MAFRIPQMLVLAIGLSFGVPSAVLAQEQCHMRAAMLLHSCADATTLRLRVLPDDTGRGNRHLLSVAGTYSSGDRFGIEGLVIQSGTIVSHRYQNWDGVLVIDKNSVPDLFHAKNVVIGSMAYDLKNKPSRDAFVIKALDMGLTVIQSHLLISNGTLDLSDVEDAPEFKRRLLVTFDDGSFGVWETTSVETLYTAAKQVLDALKPKMALNLDMGAYDYCQSGPKDAEQDCGRLIVSADKLTNLLEFTKR